MDESKVTWYRLESAKVMLCILAETNGKYITCCKAARENVDDKIVRINYDQKEIKKVQDSQEKKQIIMNIKDYIYGDISIKINEAVGDIPHLTASRDSEFISGAIRKEDGDKLFWSSYFHNNDFKKNNIITKKDAPIFLRIRTPVKKLIKLPGGDTVVTNDVISLGDDVKPGFIPLEWVDRISWIVDLDAYGKENDENIEKKKLREEMKEKLKEISTYDDVRQFPCKKDIENGEYFGKDKKYLLEAINMLKTIGWIKDLDKVIDLKKI
jgi:hypothetical protein